MRKLHLLLASLFALCLTPSASAQLDPGLAPVPLSSSAVFQALQARVANIEAKTVDVNVACGADIYAPVIAAIAAHPQRVLRLPACALTLSQPLNFTDYNSGLVGYGAQQTIITYTGTLGSTCALRGGPSSVSGGQTISGSTFGGFTLQVTSRDTTGCGIRLEQTVMARVRDVELGEFYIGADLVGANNVFINNVFIRYGLYGPGSLTTGSRFMRVRAGYKKDGTANAQVTYGVYVSNSTMVGAPTGGARTEVGIELQGVDGYYQTGPNYLGEAQTLMLVQPQNANVYLANIMITGTFFDGNPVSGAPQSTHGFRIVANGAAPSVYISKVTFTGNIVSNLSGFGVNIDSPLARNIIIAANNIDAAEIACIDLNNSQSVSVTGNVLTACGTSGDRTTGAWRYTSGNTVLTITGNTVQGNASPTGVVARSAPIHLQQAVNASSSGVLAVVNN